MRRSEAQADRGAAVVLGRRAASRLRPDPRLAVARAVRQREADAAADRLDGLVGTVLPACVSLTATFITSSAAMAFTGVDALPLHGFCAIVHDRLFLPCVSRVSFGMALEQSCEKRVGAFPRPCRAWTRVTDWLGCLSQDRGLRRRRADRRLVLLSPVSAQLANQQLPGPVAPVHDGADVTCLDGNRASCSIARCSIARRTLRMHDE